MSEQLPEEVWEVGPVEDPGVVLGPAMPVEEFYPRIIEMVEIVDKSDHTTPNSIGNYWV